MVKRYKLPLIEYISTWDVIYSMTMQHNEQCCSVYLKVDKRVELKNFYDSENFFFFGIYMSQQMLTKFNVVILSQHI